MARILSVTTNSSPKISYTVDASEIARTPTTVTVRYTVRGWVASSAGWLYTGHAINVTIHGVTRQLKSSSAKWNAGQGNTITVDVTFNAAAGTTSVSGVVFSAVNTYGSAGDLSARTCSSYSISSAVASFSSVSISASVKDQTCATATITGLPKVSYATSIHWYLGSERISTVNRAASAQASSYSYTFTGLEPSTSYTVKAIVYGGSTAMSTKTVSFTTPNETGGLALNPASTYITAQITGMYNTPSYTRSIEVYYKRSKDSDYILFAELKEQGASKKVNVTGLISNVSYDIRVVIKNGGITLVTLDEAASTPQDTSLLPMPAIEEITQRLGTRECTIRWITDKKIAGTTYVIEAQAEGESEWVQLETLEDVESPVLVTSRAGNKNVSFRISSSNEYIAASTTVYSEVFVFYVRDDFVWDTPKTTGAPLVITANEWNRLREYAVARNRDEGREVYIPLVSTGDPISADMYNTMKNAISYVKAVNATTKTRGDAITAADIDALRLAINSVS